VNISKSKRVQTYQYFNLGVSLRKARDMEDVLSHLLKSDREPLRSGLAPSNTPHPASTVSLTDTNEVTHAWLLDQCKIETILSFHSNQFFLSVLKSQGAPDSQNYIHQIIRAHPKFAPLLHSRIPQNLIPIIWNDPVMKRLASIIGNKPVIQFFLQICH
jgi:hypothetical protein